MKTRLGFSTLIALLLASASVSDGSTLALPQEVVTAQFYGPAYPGRGPFHQDSGLGVIADSQVAQTFLTTESGFLSTVELSIEMRFSNATTDPLVIGLYSTEGGLPGQLLAEAQILAADVPVIASRHDFSVLADFGDSDLFLDAGETYAILSGSEIYTFYGRGVIRRFGEEPVPSYADGRLMRDDGPESTWWTPPPDKDAYFRVTVVVPEPGVMALLSLGALGWLGVRRR